jgi:hypothetical protein
MGDKRLNAVLNGGMGGEQVDETGMLVLDAHFHQTGGGTGQFSPAGNLEQRRDHRIGVLGQFHCPGIGQIFARARQGQPQQAGQQPGHKNDGAGQEQRRGRWTGTAT